MQEKFFKFTHALKRGLVLALVKKLTVDFSNKYNNIMDVDFLICASAKLPHDILESKLDGTISPIGFGCYRKQRIDYY